MPARELTITIFGDDRIEHNLLNGERVVANMRPALDEVADDMMGIIGINFSSEGRRGGGSWQHLSEERVRQKTKLGILDKGILVASGALHDSVTQRGDKDMDLQVTNQSIRLGSLVPYAPIHNYGEGHMPMRPFMKFLPNDRYHWVAICSDHVYNALNGR